jgi:hypothetical protein
MGRRRWARVIAVVAVGAALAACGSQSGTTASMPPPAAPFALDSGGLRVTPVTARDTRVPAADAVRVLALQYQHVQSMAEPVLATVTWSAASTGSGPTRLTVQPGALAWVLVYQPRFAEPGCPAAGLTGTPSAPGSERSAVIVDATTGDAAVYWGSFPICHSWTTPSIAGAARYVSLAWTIEGSAYGVTQKPYVVQLPSCAALAGSGSDDFVMTIVAAEPLVGGCSGAARTTAVEGTASPRYAVHAPVGLLCSAGDAGVAVPRPDGCVLRRT